MPLWESPGVAGEAVARKFQFGILLPAWWPAIAWPYFVFIGSAVTFLLGILFPTGVGTSIGACRENRASA